MLSEDLMVCCNDCTTWHTEAESGYSNIFDEPMVCRACNGNNLWHAHETGNPTPWQEMQADVVRTAIRHYKRLVFDLESELELLVQ